MRETWRNLKFKIRFYIILHHSTMGVSDVILFFTIPVSNVLFSLTRLIVKSTKLKSTEINWNQHQIILLLLIPFPWNCPSLFLINASCIRASVLNLGQKIFFQNLLEVCTKLHTQITSFCKKYNRIQWKLTQGCHALIKTEFPVFSLCSFHFPCVFYW